MSTVTLHDPLRDVTRKSRSLTNVYFNCHAPCHAPSRGVQVTQPLRERGVRDTWEVTA